jgi:DNA-3-methyladenine glycosylase II
MQRYTSVSDLEIAIAHLVAIEPRFGAVHARHGTPSLRQAEPGLAGLLMIVTEQFLSLSAAAAIWNRVVTAIQPMSPEVLLTVEAEQLKALGLSNAKIRTFHAAAQAVLSGELDFENLAAMENAAVHATLCKLPGIGPWTADIFLLGNLQRADAWPVGDLALQVAAQDLLALGERPSPRAMQVLGETWRPHRAAAARLLWAHYRSLKGLTQA